MINFRMSGSLMKLSRVVAVRNLVVGSLAEQSRAGQRTMFQPRQSTVQLVFEKLRDISTLRGHAKPSLTIGVQNLKTIKKPLKAMVWGLKIIKWRWLNDPKTIEKPSSPMVSY